MKCKDGGRAAEDDNDWIYVGSSLCGPPTFLQQRAFLLNYSCRKRKTKSLFSREAFSRNHPFFFQFIKGNGCIFPHLSLQPRIILNSAFTCRRWRSGRMTPSAAGNRLIIRRRAAALPSPHCFGFCFCRGFIQFRARSWFASWMSHASACAHASPPAVEAAAD